MDEGSIVWFRHIADDSADVGGGGVGGRRRRGSSVSRRPSITSPSLQPSRGGDSGVDGSGGCGLGLAGGLAWRGHWRRGKVLESSCALTTTAASNGATTTPTEEGDKGQRRGRTTEAARSTQSGADDNSSSTAASCYRVAPLIGG